ncbi:MAG: DUF2141 domain-containing protein [Bacteroidetes bacterium]|nr:DUF2141 domain-containing protein [Bacteroidota bacterium]
MLPISSFRGPEDGHGFSLKVEVSGTRNSNGSLLFALYNREDAFPDEHYIKYFRKISGEIVNGTSTVIFKNLPKGKYAVSILHDENNDEKIDKGFILPVEGIGFSNYQAIGLSNRPNFKKASFILNGNKAITIKIIYL